MRDCSHCGRPTSIYSVIHRCPECDALLESPRRQIGSHTFCPVCRDRILVPSDALFNDNRDVPDYHWYVFQCPACYRMLRTPPGNASKTAVCPECSRHLTVPMGGETIASPPPLPTDDPREKIDQSLTRPCRHCQSPVPLRAAQCWACGHEL